jgi:phenylalanyl-tRNA synthetase alpha chain
MTTIRTLSADQVRRALSIRDLTDPEQGRHAMQTLVDEVEDALGGRLGVPVRRHRANPVVTVADNYDRLRVPAEAAARDARYSRYITRDIMLRAHTSANLPGALESLSATPVADVTVSSPGICYRRDAIGRRHVGEPHQHDVWRIRCGGPSLGEEDLKELIATVVEAAVPAARWRTIPAEHPYTRAGRQVDVDSGGDWVEVGECGLAHPEVLARSGLGGASGLASGWGLDRLLMLRKGIDDIRLLRSTDPRVARQMIDLEPYQPVSPMPAARSVPSPTAERTEPAFGVPASVTPRWSG